MHPQDLWIIVQSLADVSERADQIAGPSFPFAVEHAQADQPAARRDAVEPLGLSLVHTSLTRHFDACMLVVVHVLFVNSIFALEYDDWMGKRIHARGCLEAPFRCASGNNSGDVRAMTIVVPERPFPVLSHFRVAILGGRLDIRIW